MSSRTIFEETLAGDGTLLSSLFDVREFNQLLYRFFLVGSGGGAFNILAGDGVIMEPVKLISDLDGGSFRLIPLFVSSFTAVIVTDFVQMRINNAVAADVDVVIQHESRN